MIDGSAASAHKLAEQRAPREHALPRASSDPPSEMTHVCGVDHVCGFEGGQGKQCRSYCGRLLRNGPVRKNATMKPDCVVCAMMWTDDEPARRRWSK